MNDLGARILTDSKANLVGELLREFTFPGEGFGCYSTFEVRADARTWSETERVEHWRAFEFPDDEDVGSTAAEVAGLGNGCSYDLDGFQIAACWYWDGDGMLTFVVRRDGQVLRCLSNSDCKKNYNWEDETLAASGT